MRNPKTHRAEFHFDPLGSASVGAVSLSGLDATLMNSLERHTLNGGTLHDLFRVTVKQTEFQNEGMAGMVGRYELLQDGVRFTPHFPFESGLAYRACFNPQTLGRTDDSQILTHEFSIPNLPDTLPTIVKHVFPSADHLPENLLRFYVGFSNSMQRGTVEAEITLLGPDGNTATDVLYRAPVELWDRHMEYLTVLLDPGRLKRGVGPNRALGPPLKVGQMYTLAIGSGMLDLSGQPLTDTFCKRFCVTEAVREPIAVNEWTIKPPASRTSDPLVLLFPRPLDWALLRIGIAPSREGAQLQGEIVIDQCEQRWSFTPAVPWVQGSYDVRISPSLEDVAGNSILAAFDRPLRSGSDLQYEVASPFIGFRVE
jgi:hypothetical protein